MTALDRAIELVGGTTSLARRIGVCQSAVSNWSARGRIPVERCLDIERATGGVVTRAELRPDIWPPSEYAHSGKQERRA